MGAVSHFVEAESGGVADGFPGEAVEGAGEVVEGACAAAEFLRGLGHRVHGHDTET